MKIKFLTKKQAAKLCSLEDACFYPYPVITREGEREIKRGLRQKHKNWQSGKIPDKVIGAYADDIIDHMLGENGIYFEISAMHSVSGHSEIVDLTGKAIGWRILS